MNVIDELINVGWENAMRSDTLKHFNWKQVSPQDGFDQEYLERQIVFLRVVIKRRRSQQISSPPDVVPYTGTLLQKAIDIHTLEGSLACVFYHCRSGLRWHKDFKPTTHYTRRMIAQMAMED